MSNINEYGYFDNRYKSIELRKTTTDDLRPNFPENKIKVRPTNQFFIIYIFAMCASNYQSWLEFTHNLPDEINKKMFRKVGLIEREI